MMLDAMNGNHPSFHLIDDHVLGNNGSVDNISKFENIIVMINGFIFNSDQICKSYGFLNKTDTELIAQLYRRFGFEKTISKIDGELTILLLDLDNSIIYISRDRLGLKSVYYYFGNEYICIASQPVAIAKLKNFNPVINKQYLALQLGSHYRTFDNDVDASPFLKYKSVASRFIY